MAELDRRIAEMPEGDERTRAQRARRRWRHRQGRALQRARGCGASADPLTRPAGPARRRTAAAQSTLAGPPSWRQPPSVQTLEGAVLACARARGVTLRGAGAPRRRRRRGIGPLTWANEPG
jgi:hypothetical protein